MFGTKIILIYFVPFWGSLLSNTPSKYVSVCIYYSISTHANVCVRELVLAIPKIIFGLRIICVCFGDVQSVVSVK